MDEAGEIVDRELPRVVLDPTVLAVSPPTDSDEPVPTNEDTETDHPDPNGSTTTQHTSSEDLEASHGR